MPKKRRVVVPKDNELFIPVFKPGDRFYRKNLGDLTNKASSNCIYFDNDNGNDANNGLSYGSPVKTVDRLKALMMEHNFFKVHIVNAEASIDITEFQPYGYLTIEADGECTVSCSEMANTSGFLGLTLQSGIFVISGTILVYQSGFNLNVDCESIYASSVYIKGANNIVNDIDVSLANTNVNIQADKLVNIAELYITSSDESYELGRDSIGDLIINAKSGPVICPSYNFSSNRLIINSPEIELGYSYTLSLLDLTSNYLTIYSINTGSKTKCGTVNIRKLGDDHPAMDSYTHAVKSPMLYIGSIYPNYFPDLSDNAWNCCPYINIDWDGLITHNGFIYCTSYNEKSLGHSSNSSDLEILVSAYDGWDDHIGWAPNYNGVNLEVKESATKFVGDNNGSGEEYGYLFVGSVASFIHVDGIYSKYSKLTIRAPYLTAHDQSMYFYSHFADINCDNIVAQSLFRVQPAMIAYADDESPTWNNSDYTILSEVHISAKVAMLQTGSNFDYCSNQDWFIECDRIQLMGASAKVLNIKADELVVASRIYANEIHFDIGNLTNATGNNICEIYGYSFESYDYKYHWSDIPVTNSTVNIKNLILTSNTLNNGVFGFQMSSSYPTVVRNLNLNIDIVTCSLNWSGGKYCPIIGSCSNYNGEISGEIGRIINSYNGQVQMVSPWNHDLILYTTFDPVSSNWNSNSRISLHLAERNALFNVYIDPDQGDDAFDGMTKNTAVRTIVGLYRYLKRNRMIDYSHASSNYYLEIKPFLAIHVLSGGIHGNRGASAFEFLVSPSQVNDPDLTSTCELWFNYLEIIPEAPNLSAEFTYVHCLAVFSCKDFYQVKFNGLHSNGGIYVNAGEGVTINNNVSSPAWYYYSECPYGSSQTLQRSALMVLDAYNISITGMFTNVRANARNELRVYDSYGGSSYDDSNCCLTGCCSLKAGYGINLGTSNSFIGLSGRCSIESDGYLYTYIDTLKGETDLISKLSSSHYSLGSSYMSGKLKLVSNDNIGLYTQSARGSCFSGTGNYGSGSNYPGNYILIDAKNQINGSISNLFRCDFIVRCNQFSLGVITIYGDNSRAIFDVCENDTQISFYNYYYFSMKAVKNSQVITKGSGGPISESGYSRIVLDIDVMQSGIKLPVHGAINNTEITARFVTDTSYVIYWTEDPTGQSSTGPYSFNITVDHSDYNPIAPADKYTNYGKTAIPTNATGEILILNDRKNLVAGKNIDIRDSGDQVTISAKTDTDIVEVPVEISNGLATAELQLGKYNVIKGIDSTVTDLEIKLPINSSSVILTELGFEFYLDAFSSGLNSVTFTNPEVEFATIMPTSFISEHLYQGTLVHRCVTLASYEKEDTNVVEINGKKYKTVKIGEQTWMAQNLADNSSGVWYDNDQTTYEPLGYGKLYTQSEAEAIANNVPGWHLPTKSDYEILVNTVGGVDQYNKLKSTSGWITDLNGTNESGFNSYPAGYGYNDGVRFGNVTEYSFLKTSSIGSDQDTHIFFQLCPSQDARFQSMSDLSKLSVRLVKDMSVNIGGRDYKIVQIGNQLWTAENLDWKYGCNIGGANPMNSPNANYLDDDEATNGINGTKYGLKYNGYCISEINSLLPDGWHVATSQDWDSIRSISNIGTKLKSTTGWTTNNGTDDYGFNGTPANGNGGSVNYWGNSNSDSKYSYSLNDTYYPSTVYYVGGYGLTSTAYIRLVKNLT